MGAQEGNWKFWRNNGFACGGSQQNPLWQVDQNGNMAIGGNFTVSGNQTYTGLFAIANLQNTTTPLDATVLALGTSPAVANALQGGSASANEMWIALGANTSGAHVFGLKTRASGSAAPATTAVVTGDSLLSIHGAGADGTNYVDSAGIQFLTAGTIGTGRVPSQIRFFTGTDVATTIKTLALTITQAQQAQFAGTVMAANIQNSVTALDATVTAIAPSPGIAGVSAPGTNAQVVLVSTGASATGVQFVAAKTRAATAGGPSTTAVTTADELLDIRAFGADGTNYVESSKLVFKSAGTIGTGRVPGQFSIFTGTDVTTTVLTEGLRVDQAQNVKLGNFTGSLLAQGATGGFVHIPACATGKPNGTPGLLLTGLVPMVFDSVSSKLAIYTGGAWVESGAFA